MSRCYSNSSSGSPLTKELIVSAISQIQNLVKTTYKTKAQRATEITDIVSSLSRYGDGAFPTYFYIDGVQDPSPTIMHVSLVGDLFGEHVPNQASDVTYHISLATYLHNAQLRTLGLDTAGTGAIASQSPAYTGYTGIQGTVSHVIGDAQANNNFPQGYTNVPPPTVNYNNPYQNAVRNGRTAPCRSYY
jgi:hypothetical protein